MRRVLCLALVALVACSDSTKPYQSVGGTWVGRGFDGTDSADLNLTITDRGGPLQGFLEIEGKAHLFTGTHTRPRIEGHAILGGVDTALIDGTVNGDILTGTMQQDAWQASFRMVRH